MIPLRDSNRIKNLPLTTYGLILINVLAFATFKLRLSGDWELLHGLALVPGKVDWCLQNLELIGRDPFVFLQTLVQPFLTSLFLHVDGE